MLARKMLAVRRNAAGPILTPNLVSFWSLEEASGNRADAHGSNTLAPTNTPGNAAGKVGNAAAFVAASTHYLSIASNASLSTGNIDFTIAGWVLFDSTATVTPFFAKWLSAGNQREYTIDLASNRIRFNVSSTGSNTVTATSTTPVISTATWYFVVVWHDATADTINIQVNDGTVYSTSHAGGVFAGAADVSLGKNAYTSYLSGLMDQWMFAKEVYSSTVRTWLYNSGNGRSYAEVAAYAG